MTVDLSLPIGSIFGEFRICQELGEGAYGSVYKAIWSQTGESVALKVLHRKHLSDRDAVQRFLREAEALRLLNHPNVVDVLAFGEEDGVPYIVLEYLEGVALDRRTVPSERLAVGDSLDIMLPVLTAVDALHDAGIVHRDLKPGNIFLVKDSMRPIGIPKVLDFGLAKVGRPDARPGLTLPMTGMGTPNYMSPEQIRDARNASPLSDQFSLGVILYFLLTTNKPFDAPTPMEIIKRVLDGRFEPPSTLVTLPAEMEQVVLRAMRADPAERFPSLRAMGRALLPFAHPSTRALLAQDFAEPLAVGAQKVSAPTMRAPSLGPLEMTSSLELERFARVLAARSQRRENDGRETRWMLFAWMGLLAMSASFVMIVGGRNSGEARVHAERAGSRSAPHEVQRPDPAVVLERVPQPIPESVSATVPPEPIIAVDAPDSMDSSVQVSAEASLDVGVVTEETISVRDVAPRARGRAPTTVPADRQTTSRAEARAPTPTVRPRVAPTIHRPNRAVQPPPPAVQTDSHGNPNF